MAALQCVGDTTDVAADEIGWCELACKTLTRADVPQFTFHLLGLDHVPVNRTFSACAFTQKIFNLGKMLKKLGHIVHLYASEGSDPSCCTEHIETHKVVDIRRAFGDNPSDPSHDTNTDLTDLGYNWRQDFFRNTFHLAGPDETVDKSKSPLALKFRQMCVKGINARRRPNHFLLATMGHAHKAIADEVQLNLTCEPGIGYIGTFAKYLAFESTAIYHYALGNGAKRYDIRNGEYYWRVIPNYYNPEDFIVSPALDRADPDGARAAHKQYFLFIGRCIGRKGFKEMLATCASVKAPVWFCGQGIKSHDPITNTIVLHEGNLAVQLAPNVRYLGFADAARRAMLMTHARAVLCFSLFMEPFCGVNVEAQLCGTPPICSNFGAFVDTVEQNKTGFLCSTRNDIVLAMSRAHLLDSEYIRQRALRKYSIDNVAHQFNKWFHDLYDLHCRNVEPHGGWTNVHPTTLHLYQQSC